jgi:hypothetical protein
MTDSFQADMNGSFVDPNAEHTARDEPREPTAIAGPFARAIRAA